eukprot:Awhi_evm1s15192
MRKITNAEVWKAKVANGNKKAFKFVFFDHFATLAAICEEISLHSQCQDYGGVINLDGFYRRKKYFVLVMDLAKESLYFWLKQQNTLNEHQVFKMAKALATFLKEAHDNNIMHRDIKTANILLKQNASEGDLECFISDFGLSYQFEE